MFSILALLGTLFYFSFSFLSCLRDKFFTVIFLFMMEEAPACNICNIYSTYYTYATHSNGLKKHLIPFELLKFFVSNNLLITICFLIYDSVVYNLLSRRLFILILFQFGIIIVYRILYLISSYICMIM